MRRPNKNNTKMAASSCDRFNVMSILQVVSFSNFRLLTLMLPITLLVAATSPGAGAINPVLNLNETFPYLIDPKSGHVTEPRDYMDFENIYAPDEAYTRNLTAQSRNYHLLKAFDFANYFQSDYWHYSDPQDLALSALPVANEEVCGQQLAWIMSALDGPSRDMILFQAGMQHVNLMTYIDSFGKPEPSTYSGRNIWPGSYWECLNNEIDMDQFEREQCRNNKHTNEIQQSTTSGHCDQKHAVKVSTGSDSIDHATRRLIKPRYCMGKARDIDWPKDDNYKPEITYKIGLCLPETCQTSSFKNNRKELDFLMKVNMPEVWRRRINLTELYCLPDERSPIRQISLPGKIYLTLITIWALILLLGTIFYSYYKQFELSQQQAIYKELATCEEPANKGLASENGLQEAKVNGDLQVTTSGAQVNFPATTRQHKENSNWLIGVFRENPTLIKCMRAVSLLENIRAFREPPKSLKEPGANKRLRVNLNALDAIKCLCCIFVIFGHIVFIHMQHLDNITRAIQMSNQWAPRMLIALFNFVDTFFIISGLLTTYFIFKRFNRKTLASPLIWLYISFLRLVRLTPVFLLIFWFIKTLSVYMWDGPLWDYATDKNSIKGLCKNDHWWKSILYLGNYGTMQPLCILPAWSIIVDAQYSLIMPGLIYVLMRFRRVGYSLLITSTCLSCVHMTWQLANQTAVKTSDMAKVRLHVYPLISRFAAEFYNTAFNRIGPVAIGIMGGHVLYLYEKGQIRKWPWYMRGKLFKLVLFVHLFVFILPALSRLTDDPTARATKDPNPIIFLVSNALVKPVWSLANTILLLRLMTDLRASSLVAKVMSHNIWFCLGKICFISYLIHYEIIIVLLKSRQDGLAEITWTSCGREFSYAFLVSTILSYILHILFEAPINHLIMILLRVERMIEKTKKSASQSDKVTELKTTGNSFSLEANQNGLAKQEADFGRNLLAARSQQQTEMTTNQGA